MHKRTIIAANWKMNLNKKQAVELAQGIVVASQQSDDKKIILMPPAVYLMEIAKVVSSSKVGLGGQNLCFKELGAYTGEIAAFQLKDIGCTHVLVGHSERRHYFEEDYETVNKKSIIALNSGLEVILCVGESREEREEGITEMVVVDQLESSFQNMSPEDCSKIIIAYEPIWAIGTGKTATPKDAAHVHTIIYQTIERLFGKSVSKEVSILYGGSVKPDNISLLMAENEIDGVLVGGASLDLSTFLNLLKKV